MWPAPYPIFPRAEFGHRAHAAVRSDGIRQDRAWTGFLVVAGETDGGDHGWPTGEGYPASKKDARAMIGEGREVDRLIAALDEFVCAPRGGAGYT